MRCKSESVLDFGFTLLLLGCAGVQFHQNFAHDMFSLLLLLALVCIALVHSFNITEINEKLESQRISAREAMKKVEASLQESRKRSQEHIQRSRDVRGRLAEQSNRRAESKKEASVAVDGVLASNPVVPSESTQKPTPAASSPHTSFSSRSLDHISYDENGLGGRAQQTLELHAVPTSLVSEINRMAAASIPREAIVKHLGTHYPDKKSHELNDIVVAAATASQHKQPDTLDTKHAAKEQAAFQNTQFERSQASFEARKREMLRQREQRAG
jgi:hypothetical protein